VLEVLQRPWRGWLLVALGIGLGVLAKGPVILVPVLPAMLFAPWWRDDRSAANWVAWYAGALGAVLVAAGIALCWAIPAGLAGGEGYREAIFWGQSAGRVVDSFAHRSAWWSYLVWLPLMWLPWVTWPRLWCAAPVDPVPGHAGRFCLAVLLPALLVFSLISGKQGKYLLPLLPLLAMLCAHWLLAADRNREAWRLGFVAVLLAAGGGLLLLLPQLVADFGWRAAISPAWGLALLAAVPLALRLRVGLLPAVRAAVAASWLSSAILHAALAEPLETAFDLQPVSAELARLQDDGRPLAWLGRYHGQFQFLGRLREPIAPLRSRHDLMQWLHEHPRGYLLVNYKVRDPDLPPGLAARPYRGGSLALWPATQLLQDRSRLDALPGSA
jgi:4-amino-4-deoxy-L-arabinose transferase-like glycosyltransferase